jgi:sugar phosphate isomerase/epimerase
MGKIGIQLISTLLSKRDDNVFYMMERFAKMGYEGIEFIDFWRGEFIPLDKLDPAKEIRKKLDDLGLPCSGMHVQWNTLVNELNKALDYNLEIGSPYMVLTRLPFDKRFDADLPKACETIYSIAEQCKKNGIRLCFHNHDWSVVEHDGRCPLDTMFDIVPADLLSLQVEIFWVECCGMDPAKFLYKYQDRIKSIHFTDKLNKVELRHTELGRGVMDIKGIIDASKRIGLDWYNVEQEYCKGDMYASLEYDCKYLKKALGR